MRFGMAHTVATIVSDHHRKMAWKHQSPEPLVGIEPACPRYEGGASPFRRQGQTETTLWRRLSNRFLHMVDPKRAGWESNPLSAS